ncbi:Making large colonies protein [Pannonibacter phragmitetus]|uniref:Making large colonies protein n=1 Tax=Pannonibacter phragmitetus TaxID=121719 RepID=A0A378ZZB0_9HYPH|nr:ROK family protein [Pannonibacter phragmitetus]SUB01881.1 Making large colonies protein [Pannonibacter phragmitetus]
MMTLAGSNHTFSGRYNRRLVFDLIRAGAGASRRSLVELTGLKPQTMSNICKELIDRSLVLEAVRQEGARGAPLKELRIRPEAGCGIGVHIDHHGLTAILCDLTGRELAREAADVRLDDPAETASVVAAIVQRLRSVVPEVPAWGVGVAMPTLQEAEFEHSVGPQGWGAWTGVPVAETIEAACGLPVIIENDATAAALAELGAGRGAGLSHYVHIFAGHGLGAGIISEGMPFQGFMNNAGEIGLLTWPADLVNPEAEGLTPFSIDELAAMLGRDARHIAAPGVLEQLYSQRNSALMRWLDVNSRRLRLLVSLLENILDPQTIIVGGHFPSIVIHSLIDRAYPLLPSVSARGQREIPRLCAGALGQEAAAAGAAMLPVIAHGSPSFRRLSLMRGRSREIDFESCFDRVAGAPSEKDAAL